MTRVERPDSWHSKRFDQLTTADLYRIIQLRERVFVVEQNCPYLDCDGKDVEALHVYAKQGEEIVAYARVLPPSDTRAQPWIGRVVTDPACRGQKLGYNVMEQSIVSAEEAYRCKEIRVSAQAISSDSTGPSALPPPAVLTWRTGSRISRWFEASDLSQDSEGQPPELAGHQYRCS